MQQKKLFVFVMIIAMLFVGCLGGGGKVENRPPKIDSVIPAEKNLEVEVNGVLNFSITASDPDGDTLEYMWEQTGGSFTEQNGATAIWKAPDSAGDATVKITVSDGKDGTVSHEWEIKVVDEKEVENQSPQIDSVNPAEKNLEVEANGILNFLITASDPDGDTLEYMWEQTGGSFTEQTGAAAIWKAPNSKGEATVKVTVSDGKGETVSHTWNIIVVEAKAHYNEHDYQKLREFLEQRKDGTGTRNGDRLSESYDPDDPETWGDFFIWTDSLEKRILSIDIWWSSGALDLSDCADLEELVIMLTELTSLDVSGCSALKYLDCEYNQLTSLDASGCSALEKLLCNQNQLTSLDVSNCSALKELRCGGNQLTLLDVNDCSALEGLICHDNQLITLDVSNCSALDLLYCVENQLITLDVSNCSALQNLDCDPNVELIGWPR